MLFEENKSKKLKLKKNITKNLTHQNFYPNRSVEAVIIKDELDNTTLKNNKSIFGKHRNCFKECYKFIDKPESVMPALSHNVIEKFTALNSGEKSKKLIGMSKLNHNMIRRVSLLKTKGGLNSTIDQENIQKLIQQNNQTKFVHFDDAIYAFWKHSQKIAMKVLAEKVEKKRDNHSRSNLESSKSYKLMFLTKHSNSWAKWKTICLIIFNYSYTTPNRSNFTRIR